jgi:hypothetical protein
VVAGAQWVVADALGSVLLVHARIRGPAAAVELRRAEGTIEAMTLAGGHALAAVDVPASGAAPAVVVARDADGEIVDRLPVTLPSGDRRPCTGICIGGSARGGETSTTFAFGRGKRRP